MSQFMPQCRCWQILTTQPQICTKRPHSMTRPWWRSIPAGANIGKCAYSESGWNPGVHFPDSQAYKWSKVVLNSKMVLKSLKFNLWSQHKLWIGNIFWIMCTCVIKIVKSNWHMIFNICMFYYLYLMVQSKILWCALNLQRSTNPEHVSANL